MPGSPVGRRHQGFPGFADIGLPEGGHRGDVVGAGQANPVLLWRRIELLADPQQVAVGIDQGEFAHTPGLVFQGRDAWNPLAAQAEGRGLAMQRLGVLQAQVGSAAIGLRFERFEQRQVQLQGAALEDGVGRIASAKVEAEDW